MQNIVLLSWSGFTSGLGGLGHHVSLAYEIRLWIEHTPRLQNLTMLLQLSYLKELLQCSCFFKEYKSKWRTCDFFFFSQAEIKINSTLRKAWLTSNVCYFERYKAISFKYWEQEGLNINLIGLNLILWLYLIGAMLYYTKKGKNYVIFINMSSVTWSFGLISIDKLQMIWILFFSHSYF